MGCLLELVEGGLKLCEWLVGKPGLELASAEEAEVGCDDRVERRAQGSRYVVGEAGLKVVAEKRTRV